MGISVKYVVKTEIASDTNIANDTLLPIEDKFYKKYKAKILINKGSDNGKDQEDAWLFIENMWEAAFFKDGKIEQYIHNDFSGLSNNNKIILNKGLAIFNAEASLIYASPFSIYLGSKSCKVVGNIAVVIFDYVIESFVKTSDSNHHLRREDGIYSYTLIKDIVDWKLLASTGGEI
ncbi:hypothetical protein [Klebsiella variicola]|uniref:hypothetical protein n=1 Tax=Klebsiella TaxID=570 RepID=UPI003A97622E